MIGATILLALAYVIEFKQNEKNDDRRSSVALMVPLFIAAAGWTAEQFVRWLAGAVVALFT